MTTCINLKERFGDRFQIELDESYHGQYGENARTVDPWYMQIPWRTRHDQSIALDNERRFCACKV